jgi:predicted dehydrogenase
VTRPRLAVIGVGRWGRNLVRTVAGGQDAQLVAVASGNPETDALLPSGCRRHADWRALLTHEELDGVVVCTPPATHAEVTLAAFARGLHVMVEKPWALSWTECERMQCAALTAGRSLLVEQTQLFNPRFRALLASLPRIGKVRAIQTRAGNFGPYRTDAPVLWDWGAHDIGMVLALTGESPDSIRARRLGARVRDDGADECTWEIVLAFPTLTAEIVIGNQCPRQRTVTVLGEHGSLHFDDVAPDALRFEANGAQEVLAVSDGRSPLAVAVAEFAHACRGHPPAPRPLAIAGEVTRILAACDRDGHRLPASAGTSAR